MNKKEKDIPDIEIVDINLLKTDDKNPNILSPQQMEALKKNIRRYGFIVPIITNKEYIIADGEHRLICAKELNYTRVPIIRLNVDEVDRRMLRQILNKLKGTHDYYLDVDEYKYILENDDDKIFAELLAQPTDEINKFVLSEEFQRIPNVPIQGEVIEKNDILIIELSDPECADFIRTFFEIGAKKSVSGKYIKEIIESKMKQ